VGQLTATLSSSAACFTTVLICHNAHFARQHVTREGGGVMGGKRTTFSTQSPAYVVAQPEASVTAEAKHALLPDIKPTPPGCPCSQTRVASTCHCHCWSQQTQRS
jgi:hypothetical protein